MSKELSTIKNTLSAINKKLDGVVADTWISEKAAAERIGVALSTMRSYRTSRPLGEAWRYRQCAVAVRKDGKTNRRGIQWNLRYINEHFYITAA